MIAMKIMSRERTIYLKGRRGNFHALSEAITNFLAISLQGRILRFHGVISRGNLQACGELAQRALLADSRIAR